MSEKTIRNWVKAGQIPMERTAHGRRIPRGALLEHLRERARAAVEQVPPEASSERHTGPAPDLVPEQVPETIEAAYRVTPAEIEQAVERTGAKYVADLQTMYQTISEDYRRLYEAQLAAKDEMIVELRRRAEIAERALALPEGSPVGTPTTKNGHGGTETAEPRLGLWRRLMGTLGA